MNEEKEITQCNKTSEYVYWPNKTLNQMYEKYRNFKYFLQYLKFNGQIPEVTEDNKHLFEEGW